LFTVYSPYISVRCIDLVTANVTLSDHDNAPAAADTIAAADALFIHNVSQLTHQETWRVHVPTNNSCNVTTCRVTAWLVVKHALMIYI
jgi:hypothetical protein